MTKKKKTGLVIGLAALGALSIAGGAFAATVWITGAKNESNTITTGQAYVMTLTNTGTPTGNVGMLPGGVATFSVNADNKNFNSTLTIAVKSEDKQTDYSEYFTIEYDVGATGSFSAYSSAVAVAASTTAQQVDLKFTMDNDAPVTLADQTFYVVLELNEA